MDRTKRGIRLAALAADLAQSPNRVIPYGVFCDRFGAAKSSVSEDMGIVRDAMAAYGLGELETVAGAAGGVRFRPILPWDEAARVMDSVARTLNAPDRALPGGYLYVSDILADPVLTKKMGAVMAAPFYGSEVDFVLTMETKGIPVAMMTAAALDVPLVIARRVSKVYEGSAVNMSFPDSKGGVETMSLARRAVKPGGTALIVDDFMRQGGTALGMISLMKEFDTCVAGLAFMLAQEREAPLTDLPEWPLLTFTGDGISSPIRVKTAAWLTEKGAQAR